MPEVRELCRRIWFDTAAGPFLYAPSAYRAVADLCGADRLLFGSDHPLLPARRYIDAFAQADLTAAERALVMGDNAMRSSVCDTVPLPLHICVAPSEAAFGGFGTLCFGRRNRRPPAGPSPLFVTRIGGFGPRPWSQ